MYPLTDFVHTLQQIDRISIVTSHKFGHSTDAGCAAAVVADVASQRRKVCDTRQACKREHVGNRDLLDLLGRVRAAARRAGWFHAHLMLAHVSSSGRR